MTALAAGPVIMRESKVSGTKYLYSYARWASKHIAAKGEMRVVLPSVNIYDPSGVVVYHGEKVASDADVLEHLPQRIQGLRSSGIYPGLQDALEMLPDLANDKSSILSSGRYSVVSITSPMGCPKCGLQEAAIAKLKQLNPRANVNVLEVRIQ
jgi:hypothetical protein